MNKILINGHGWSGSSAFIDLLSNTPSKEYFLVPGEFDDFRVPGTLRELFEGENLPVSHRRRQLKTMIKLKIRSLIKDRYWHKSLPGENLSQQQANILFKTQNIERRAFAACVKRAFYNKIEPTGNLKQWFNTLNEEFLTIGHTKKAIIYEQFLLFDDDPKLYDWLDFDKLLLFIRSPSKQLSATLESTVLYSDYPWHVDFLLGSAGRNQYRKQSSFLATTINRYDWMLEFLETIPRNKICIINFDTFLYSFSDAMQHIMKFLDLDLRENLSKFVVTKSQERDKKWTSQNPELNKGLLLAEEAFALFLEKLQNKFEVI